MAKGAANESALGDLHAKLARIFTQVLETYERRLETMHQADDAVELTEDMVAALLNANLEPSPAMLGAISKFLKDNSIAFDSEEIDVLSGTAQRLADRRTNRKGLVNLTDLRVVDNG